MSGKRARFIGPDGFSFFEEIGCAREVYLRAVPVDPRWDFGAVLWVRTEVYRREVWFVPVGPIACPIGDPGEQLDAVYRFERLD